MWYDNPLGIVLRLGLTRVEGRLYRGIPIRGTAQHHILVQFQLYHSTIFDSYKAI